MTREEDTARMVEDRWAEMADAAYLAEPATVEDPVKAAADDYRRRYLEEGLGAWGDYVAEVAEATRGLSPDSLVGVIADLALELSHGRYARRAR